MRIGELAQRSGLAPSRIRFYERIGLLKLVQRRANGYRDYPKEALLALQLISTAQDAGFALDELRVLLPGDMTTWNHGELLAALREKLQSIEALQKRLEQGRSQLTAVIAKIVAKPEDMACADNARLVLSDLQGPPAGDSRETKHTRRQARADVANGITRNRRPGAIRD